MNFAAVYCLYLHSSSSSHLKLRGIYTKYRKTLNIANSSVQICTPANPYFTLLTVPDTRTACNFCCLFNWKRKTNGNLSRVTSPGHLIQVSC